MPRFLIALTPNLLSALRIAMGVMFPFSPDKGARASLILVAGLSDMIDGFVARRLGVASPTGGHVDAVTDKVFVMSVLITLVVQGAMHPWQVVLLLSRDAVVIAVVAYIALMGRWNAFRRISARHFGKLTTAAMFAMFLAIVIWPDGNPVVSTIFAITSLFSVAAAIDYLVQFLRALPQHRCAGHQVGS